MCSGAGTPWGHPAGLERDQLAATDGSTAVAESRFHLKNDVIGRVL
jgi:hypothetical protein